MEQVAHRPRRVVKAFVQLYNSSIGAWKAATTTSTHAPSYQHLQCNGRRMTAKALPTAPTTTDMFRTECELEHRSDGRIFATSATGTEHSLLSWLETSVRLVLSCRRWEHHRQAKAENESNLGSRDETRSHEITCSVTWRSPRNLNLP